MAKLLAYRMLAGGCPGLDPVWCAVAERSCWYSKTTTHIAKKEPEISAVYWLEDGQIKCGLTQTIVQHFRGR